MHYAGLDEWVNAGWAAYEKALKENDKAYEDVNYGFYNTTTPRYDKDAAKLAWKRTMVFFEKHLI